MINRERSILGGRCSLLPQINIIHALDGDERLVAYTCSWCTLLIVRTEITVVCIGIRPRRPVTCVRHSR
ncbi:hypothetical protein D3C73_990800 [compost metagenome]